MRPAAVAHTAPRPPPSSTRRLIVWDVDNARPPRGVGAAALVAVLADELGGGRRGPLAVAAFANESTWAARPDLLAGLHALGADTATTPTPLRNGADLHCASAVAAFVKHAASTSASCSLALISADAGLAPPLAHAAAAGVAALAVGAFQGGSRWRGCKLVRAAGGRGVMWGDVVERARAVERARGGSLAAAAAPCV